MLIKPRPQQNRVLNFGTYRYFTNLTMEFAEILSAEGLFTAIRRIFGLQKFLANTVAPSFLQVKASPPV